MAGRYFVIRRYETPQGTSHRILSAHTGLRAYHDAVAACRRHHRGAAHVSREDDPRFVHLFATSHSKVDNRSAVRAVANRAGVRGGADGWHPKPADPSTTGTRAPGQTAGFSCGWSSIYETARASGLAWFEPVSGQWHVLRGLYALKEAQE